MTTALTALQRLQDAIGFSCGGYSSDTACQEAITRGFAKATTALAKGQWIIEDATGVGLFDPAYAVKGFRPLRWMTKEGIATMRNLMQIKVGETFIREVSFHPRHGITTRSALRLA
jgi:hypothetical protein